ncbi:MAG TPA: hypothetical protein VFT55_01750 [Planctomycetota bacterium]|nr:hypothetical protein [Planctomycetota bacterium]
MRSRPVALIVLAAVLASPALPQRSRAQERTVADLPKSLYFVVPPREGGNKAGLVVVLPGGPGTRDFLPWVEGTLFAQIPPDCVGVMLTAVRWNDAQTTTWCQDPDDAKEMLYTTEQYVRAVVAAVEKDFAIDPARRVVLGWSSSGPPIQALLARKDSPFERAYVAMAVWPRNLDLAAVKGRRYLLDHSPEDQQTAFSHCRRAFGALTKAGASVRLVTYAGGHGWNDGPEQRLREGVQWLLSKEPPGKPVWPPGPVASSPGKLVNLVVNPGFEQGLKGWNEVSNSGHLRAEAQKQESRSGKALHLAKHGGGPLDLLRQEVELPPGSKLVASVQVKSKDAAAARAAVRVWLYDEDGQPVHQDSLLGEIPPETGWKKLERDWAVKSATHAIVQIVVIGDGEIWIDDVMVAVLK